MDFHALPRRDLQALCKRNGVRANMTNAAMADALRALTAVDGIGEYVKQTVALPTAAAKPAVKAVVEEDPREKQGSPLPRGRRVTVKSPESIRREDGEKEEEDLTRDADEEKAPALGVGQRGPSRRALPACVVAPTTRRRAAAASKSEAGDVAAEAVPAPTTRRRIQSTVAAVAEEKVPRARRTTRRAAARKAGMQQEEEEGKPQGVVSDVETVPALPVSDEGCDDPEEAEEDTNPQNDEESGQEDEGETQGETHAVVCDAVLATVSDEVCDDAEDVEEATKPQNEDEGVVMNTPTPVEEPPVVEEFKDKSAVQEPQADVQQCAAPLPSQEDTPILGLVEQEGGAAFLDGTGSDERPLDEEMSDGIHHASEEMEMVPVSELPQATLTAGETSEEVGFTGDAGHANDEENEVVAAFSELLQHGTAEANGARMEEKEDVTVDEVLNDTVTGHETVLLDFSSKISPAVVEEGVVSADEMPQISVTMDEDADEDDFDAEICRADEQQEVATVENMLQVSVTDNKVVGNENVFSGDMPLEFNSAGDSGDRISSPLFADMLDDVTKSMSNNAIAGEPTVSEAEDASRCMHSNDNEKRSTELVAVEEENEVKDENQSTEPLVLTKLSLRKLRAKLKETLVAHKRKEAKRVALARLDENVC